LTLSSIVWDFVYLVLMVFVVVCLHPSCPSPPRGRPRLTQCSLPAPPSRSYVWPLSPFLKRPQDRCSLLATARPLWGHGQFPRILTSLPLTVLVTSEFARGPRPALSRCQPFRWRSCPFSPVSFPHFVAFFFLGLWCHGPKYTVVRSPPNFPLVLSNPFPVLYFQICLWSARWATRPDPPSFLS